MAKFIIMGKYTAKGLGGFVSNPDTDRRAATTALSESVGAKLTGYAGLRGEYDFMVEVEGTFEQASASGMIAVSSGAVTDFSVHEVVDLNAIAKIAKSWGNSVIAITKDSNSSLASSADSVISIAFEKEADPLNLAPTTSTTLTIAAGDALASALMAHRGFTSQDFGKRHPGGALGKATN